MYVCCRRWRQQHAVRHGSPICWSWLCRWVGGGCVCCVGGAGSASLPLTQQEHTWRMCVCPRSCWLGCCALWYPPRPVLLLLHCCTVLATVNASTPLIPAVIYQADDTHTHMPPAALVCVCVVPPALGCRLLVCAALWVRSVTRLNAPGGDTQHHQG